MLEQLITTEQPYNRVLTPEETEKDIEKTLKGISLMEDVRVIIETRDPQQLLVDGKECGPFEKENDMYPRNETIKIVTKSGNPVIILKGKPPSHYEIIIKNPESIKVYDKHMAIIRGYKQADLGNFTLIEE